MRQIGAAIVFTVQGVLLIACIIINDLDTSVTSVTSVMPQISQNSQHLTKIAIGPYVYSIGLRHQHDTMQVGLYRFRLISLRSYHNRDSICLSIAGGSISAWAHYTTTPPLSNPHPSTSDVEPFPRQC